MKSSAAAFLVLVTIAWVPAAEAQRSAERTLLEETIELVLAAQTRERLLQQRQIQVRTAEDLYQQGRVEEALEVLQRLQQQRSEPELLFAIGQCQAALQRYTAAIEAYRQSVARGVSRPERAHLRIRAAQLALVRELESILESSRRGRSASAPEAERTLSRRPLVCRHSGIAPESIRQIVRLHGNELRGEYERARQREGTLGGRLVLRFAIALDGQVTSIDVVDGTVEDPDLRARILEVFGRIRFPSRPCGDELVVTYPLTFRPRPRYRPRDGREPRGTLVTSGPLEAELVRDELRRREPVLHEAYLAALRDQPTLDGRLVVRFNVTEAGEVYAVLVTDSSSPETGSPLRQAVESIVGGLSFPASTGDTTVVFPLVFERLEGAEQARVITP